MNPGVLTSGYAPPQMPRGLLGRPLPIPMTEPRAYDADAMAWINAVEIADGRRLEAGVCNAVNEFVLGLKADGIWGAIRTCGILSGARTLQGALVPLVGPPITNYNFVTGDYSRTLGLQAGGFKYLDTNYLHSLVPRNSEHAAVYKTTTLSAEGMYIGTIGNGTGSTSIYAGINVRLQDNTGASVAGVGWLGAGLVGAERNSSATMTFSGVGASSVLAAASQQPDPNSYYVFAARNGGVPYFFSSGRVSFFSAGTYLSVPVLARRVGQLMASFSLAIR